MEPIEEKEGLTKKQISGIIAALMVFVTAVSEILFGVPGII